MQRSLLRLLYCLAVAAFLEIGIACGGSSSNPQSAVTSTGTGEVASWVQQERLPQAAVAGAELFVSSGCTTCHTYAGSGRTNLGAPDLTAYGRLHRGVAFDVRFLRCPACVKSGSPMPAFDSLGGQRLRQLAVFLEASKGIR